MRLTLELHNNKYTVETQQNDYNGYELKEIFSRLLVAAEFPPSMLEPEDGGRFEYLEDDEIVVKKEEVKC